MIEPTLSSVSPRTVVSVIVVGGGPAGFATALGLARAGVATALITPSEPPAGTGTQARTAALFTPSITLLDALGAWSACRSASEPLTGIRLIDDTGHVLRAPDVLFRAREAGVARFGYNVPNATLAAALRQQLRDPSLPLEWIENHLVTGVSVGPNFATLTLDDGRNLNASLIIAADGRRSICRMGAGIGVFETTYDQTAVTATFAHQRPHQGISTEFHRATGPCTTVPLPGHRSALVWVERPAIAQRLLDLDDTAFLAALEVQLKGLLGSLSDPTPRGQFALSALRAKTTAATRVMLVGEAAHVMAPIGAQGLNLGLRDVGFAIDCVVDAVAAGRDPGGAETLAHYNATRVGDIGLRMTAVDALNRSLLADVLPVHLARGAGLYALSALGPLRRRAMAAGMAPTGPLPRLMREPSPPARSFVAHSPRAFGRP